MTETEQAQSIKAALDRLLSWMQLWERALLFGDLETLTSQRAAPPPPSSFDLDRHAPTIPDQPALAQVLELAEQLYNAAQRETADILAGGTWTKADYDAVMEPYWRLVNLLRRLERAFAVAHSTIDPLTGLKSRRAMMPELRSELNRSRRSGQPLTIALCDLDHFKAINDSCGHDAGDRVLASAAAVIAENTRSFDDAYRMGGEEFLIALKNTDLDAGCAVVERLRQAITETAVPIREPDDPAEVERTLSVTASFGIAEAGTHGGDVDALLRSADRALYEAKAAGRNCLKVSEASEQPSIKRTG